MTISRLTKVPLRELWKHEAHGFTQWLADNLDLLSETLGFELTLDQSEISAGAFSADIRAEDPHGDYVIIENQLERTDHDHLGKLITYMSNLEAKTAIWITSEPRPEHEKAVQWLNETLPADTAFYLVKVEAYRIDESASAPLFTVIAGPSEVARAAGEKKKELAERHVLRQSFWESLLQRSKAMTQLFANKGPSTQNWIKTGAGRSGVSFSYVIRMKNASIELYIDTGDRELNKQYFDKLLGQVTHIHERFGGALMWERLDNRRACRISYSVIDLGLEDKEAWSDIQTKMIEAMIRLHAAIKPEIPKL